MSASQIIIVMSGFPRRSETFALGELLALETRGTLATIFATKPGDGGSMQPGCERLLKRVRFLPEGSSRVQADFISESFTGRRIGGIHGYFAHTPADVAARAAANLNVPYGFSVHARDARKVSPAELRERANRAACVVACNIDVAQSIEESGVRVHLVPHGVDLQCFRPQPPQSMSPDAPLQLLAVGRLVEKKGFDILLSAVTRLKFPFRLRIIGEGPERDRLSHMITANGLAGRVTLDGGMTHAELPAAYREAHVVVVPSVQDQSGDRDGLPNVVLEAMACGRPVVASDISAIGCAVAHGETGMLVPPGDPVALASALEQLCPQLALRERLSRKGRELVERDYEVGRCTERFHRLLESVYL